MEDVQRAVSKWIAPFFTAEPDPARRGRIFTLATPDWKADAVEKELRDKLQFRVKVLSVGDLEECGADPTGYQRLQQEVLSASVTS